MPLCISVNDYTYQDTGPASVSVRNLSSTKDPLRRCSHQTSQLHLENVQKKMAKKRFIIQLFTNILDTVLLNYCYYY